MSRRPRSPSPTHHSGRSSSFDASVVSQALPSKLAIKTVSSHAAAQIRLWAPTDEDGDEELRAAQALLAVGRGTGRLPTCEDTLLHARFQHAATRPIVQRALSLFRDGELQELRVADPKVIETVGAMLCEEAAAPGRLPVLSRALHSLRTLVYHGDACTYDVRALLARHAATIVELCCPTKPQSAVSGALARCTRLESLSYVSWYAPSAWLGLSQLHTLHFVNVGVVSFAVIAAALPRLHTLTCFNKWIGFTAAGADDLLPRLLVFHFDGWWPDEEAVIRRQEEEIQEGVAPRRVSQPQPRLQELVWKGHDDDDEAPEPVPLPRALLGARPVTLRAAPDVVDEWLDVYDAAPGALAVGPLHRVRHLALDDETPTLRDVVRLCAVAPQLRRLHAYICGPFPLWLIPQYAHYGSAKPAVPFRLRHIIITQCAFAAEPSNVADDCVARLRQWYFARLQRVTVNEEHYKEDYFAPFE